MLPKRESGPQNQPNAKVAVSVTIGAEASISGMPSMGKDPLSFIVTVIASLLQPIGLKLKIIPRINKPSNTTKFVFVRFLISNIDPSVYKHQQYRIRYILQSLLRFYITARYAYVTFISSNPVISHRLILVA